MAEETSTTTVVEESVTDTTANSTADDVAALKKALEAERSARREAEKAAKAQEKETDKLRTAQMSETERAIAEAKNTGRAEAMTEMGRRLAAAEFRAAAAAANLDVAEVVDLVDVGRFVTDNGEPDGKAIAAAVEKFTALRGEPAPPVPPTFDGGFRTAPATVDDSPRGLIAAGLQASNAGIRTRT